MLSAELSRPRVCRRLDGLAFLAFFSVSVKGRDAVGCAVAADRGVLVKGASTHDLVDLLAASERRQAADYPRGLDLSGSRSLSCCLRTDRVRD